MIVTIPGKPQTKQRARRGKRGRWFTPKATRDYERSVGLLAAFARPPLWPLDAQYRVTLDLFFPDKRRRDVDNCAKAVLDGCNQILWDDDSQVAELITRRDYDKANPRAVVIVEVIGA